MSKVRFPQLQTPAIIFDMDGLLIDSEPVWMRTERELIWELVGEELSDETLLSFQGRSSRVFCEGMVTRFVKANLKVESLLEQLLTRMESNIRSAPLMPGARDLLEYLAETRVPMAIASSSPMAFIEAVVKQHQLPIRSMTSGTEVPASKPHPAVFELAAQRLSSSTSACWVWEDSVNGVIAAKAASMCAIAVPDPHHPRPEQFSIADYQHASLLQSLEWIRSEGVSCLFDVKG